MRGVSLRENREVSCSPVWSITKRAAQEGQGHTPEMNGTRRQTAGSTCEAAEQDRCTGCGGGGGKQPGRGSTDSTTRPGRSAGQGVSSGLDRVREVAQKDKDVRFTALLHHVDLSRLWAAYVAINPKASQGWTR